jgi:hypothetical protein
VTYIDLYKYKDIWSKEPGFYNLAIRRMLVKKFLDIAQVKGINDFSVHGAGGGVIKFDYFLLYHDNIGSEFVAEEIYDRLFSVKEIRCDCPEVQRLLDEEYLLMVMRRKFK